ncbi:MAG: sigma-70 family RNA polymerase sigma factor [Verrucomicrobiota bacterium]
MISEPDRRDVFLTLLSGCESRLRAFLTGALAAADERADLFQDVVLILWRNFEKYDRSRPFGPWAMGVAVRRMKEEYRRRNRRPGLLAEDHLERLANALEAGAPAAASTAEAAEPEGEAALAECLAGLPEQSARLMRRRYFDQASMELLCAEFHQSAAAVYQNLSRLRRKLADCIRGRLRLAADGMAPETGAEAEARPETAAGDFDRNTVHRLRNHGDSIPGPKPCAPSPPSAGNFQSVRPALSSHFHPHSNSRLP